MPVSNGFALHPWPARPRNGSTADFGPSGSRLDGAAMLVQEMLKKDAFSKQQHPTSRGDSIAPSQSQPCDGLRSKECDGLRSKEREPLSRAAALASGSSLGGTASFRIHGSSGNAILDWRE
jgi:hypothetical protein